ncbi:hypothetical protein FIP36_16970 [Salmonella enterica]|nr:hypothetical protein [Salmonella enterica]
MLSDFTMGFVGNSARSSVKVVERKVTLPGENGSYAHLKLSGLQCHPSCRFPLYQLLMSIHNQFSSLRTSENEKTFCIKIKSNEWLSRSRIAFYDYYCLRNSEKMAEITLDHLEELLLCLSTTLSVYYPYPKKRHNFSFLSGYSYSSAAQVYSLTFPTLLKPVLDMFGAVIQQSMTEHLLKRRNNLFQVYDYLLKSNKTSHKVSEVVTDLQLNTGKVRIMSVLSQLADCGVISFLCEGRGSSRTIEELEFIPYSNRPLPAALTIEEIICAAN